MSEGFASRWHRLKSQDRKRQREPAADDPHLAAGHATPATLNPIAAVTNNDPIRIRFLL